MKPTRFDHDDALRACYSIKAGGKEHELSHELLILNQVAGAYACNDSAMCGHISTAEFHAAIAKAQRG